MAIEIGGRIGRRLKKIGRATKRFSKATMTGGLSEVRERRKRSKRKKSRRRKEDAPPPTVWDDAADLPMATPGLVFEDGEASDGVEENEQEIWDDGPDELDSDEMGAEEFLEISGRRSWRRRLRKGLKKALPIAAVALQVIPGVGTAVGLAAGVAAAAVKAREAKKKRDRALLASAYTEQYSAAGALPVAELEESPEEEEVSGDEQYSWFPR